MMSPIKKETRKSFSKQSKMTKRGSGKVKVDKRSSGRVLLAKKGSKSELETGELPSPSENNL